MFEILLGLILAVAAVVFWTLLNTYEYVPARELKRLARRGDDVARLLYRAAAYEASLRFLLSSMIAVFSVLSLSVLVTAMGLWPALLILGGMLGLGWLALIPSGELTRGSLWLAKRTAPGVAWLLERLHPFIDRFVRFVRKRRQVHVHTGLYEKSDVVELLGRQKRQPDSRISESEIELLQHALSFGDGLVSDALVPQRVVKMVAATDHIGPVLMDELSKSGHSRFPVYDGKRSNIVGILYLHDLVGVRSTGTVADLMSRKLTYVHEDFTLYQVLQAFLKTKQHLFLVVNGFEELVGILTIEGVLGQMIGRPIVDEFDRYDDMRAVAAAPLKDRKVHDEPQVEETPVDGAEPDLVEGLDGH